MHFWSYVHSTVQCKLKNFLYTFKTTLRLKIWHNKSYISSLLLKILYCVIISFLFHAFHLRILILVIFFCTMIFAFRKPLSHKISGLFFWLAQFRIRLGINVNFVGQTFILVFDIANLSGYWVPRDLNNKTMKKILFFLEHKHFL